MNAQAELPAGSAHGLEPIQRPHRSPAAIVRVLHDQQSAAGEVDVARAHRVAHVLRIELPAVATQDADHHARQCRGRTRLVVDDVAVLVRDDLVAGLSVGADGGLVGHGAGRDEAGCLFAEQLRHMPLQFDDGRIIAQNVVAQRRGRHRVQHGLGWLGDGIAAKVDRAHVGLRGESIRTRARLTSLGAVAFTPHR